MAGNSTNLVIDRLTLGRNAASSLQDQLSKIRNLSVDTSHFNLNRNALSEIQAAFEKVRPQIQVGINVKELTKEINNALTDTAKNEDKGIFGKIGLGQRAALAATVV